MLRGRRLLLLLPRAAAGVSPRGGIGPTPGEGWRARVARSMGGWDIAAH
jgi:hypothetical protein